MKFPEASSAEEAKIDPRLAILAAVGIPACVFCTYTGIRIKQFFDSPTGKLVTENSWCLPAGLIIIGLAYLTFSIQDAYNNKE